MPVFRLTSNIQFPPVRLADESGLLAIGGDLSPERLIAAYIEGVFPWYSEGDPILWWFTSPRLVLVPSEFHLPRRLARYRRTTPVTLTRNRAFSEVIAACGTVRTETGEGTWILPEMVEAYERLHTLGFAHSIECWLGEELVGGLYGVALDRVFFGESMFSRIKCGSQFALMELVDFLQNEDYELLDCQMTTDHLLRFGAKELQGETFHELLKEYIQEIKPHKHWKMS